MGEMNHEEMAVGIRRRMVSPLRCPPADQAIQDQRAERTS